MTQFLAISCLLASLALPARANICATAVAAEASVPTAMPIGVPSADARRNTERFEADLAAFADGKPNTVKERLERANTAFDGFIAEAAKVLRNEPHDFPSAMDRFAVLLFEETGIFVKARYFTRSREKIAHALAAGDEPAALRAARGGFSGFGKDQVALNLATLDLIEPVDEDDDSYGTVASGGFWRNGIWKDRSPEAAVVRWGATLVLVEEFTHVVQTWNALVRTAEILSPTGGVFRYGPKNAAQMTYSRSPRKFSDLRGWYDRFGFRSRLMTAEVDPSDEFAVRGQFVLQMLDVFSKASELDFYAFLLERCLLDRDGRPVVSDAVLRFLWSSYPSRETIYDVFFAPEKFRRALATPADLVRYLRPQVHLGELGALNDERLLRYLVVTAFGVSVPEKANEDLGRSAAALRAAGFPEREVRRYIRASL